MYLESFALPIDREEELMAIRMARNGGALGYIDNSYPCGIFPEMSLADVTFGKITIFYGGNGSGKSTLLNLIAQKLKLDRVAPFSSSQLFNDYVDACTYEMGYDDEGCRYQLPSGSRIMTSDDVFDYMLSVRTQNDDVFSHIDEGKEKWGELRYGKTVQLKSMDDYDDLRLQLLARSKSVSRRKFVQRTVGEEVHLNSNGETALDYFNSKLKNDALYCLDEPENSLSPVMQQKLAEIIESMARYCGCQFILATHSPFLLAMRGTKIYDLDARPAAVRPWWELENPKVYFSFFQKHHELFEK